MNQLQLLLRRMRERGSFASDATALLIGNIISQGISIVSILILTRIYSPTAFGDSALAISLITILGIVSCGRFDQAILLPPDDNDALGILILSLFVCSIISIFSLAIIIILWLVETHKIVDRYLLWLIPIGVFGNGTNLALSNWMIRVRQFNQLSTARVFGALFTALIQIFLGIFGWNNSLSLLIGFVGGFLCMTVLFLLFVVSRKVYLHIRCLTYHHIQSIAYRYRKFPLVQIWGSLLDTSGVQLPVILLTLLFNPEIVGYYSLAFRFVTLPITLIGSAVSQVYFQRASVTQQLGESLYTLTRSVYLRLAILGGILYLIIFMSGEQFFRFFFGHQWSETGVYAQILSISMFFQLIYASISVIFIVLELQRNILIIQIIIFLSPLLSALIIHLIFPDQPRSAITTISIINSVLFFALSIYEIRISKNKPRKII